MITASGPAWQQRGFSLIEVLVAMVVLAAALTAVIQSTTAASASQQRLAESSVARWVASNQIALLRAAPGWPELGLDQGSTQMAQRTWYWRRSVSATAEPDMRRIDVQVYSDAQQEQPVVRLSGFVGRRQRG